MRGANRGRDHRVFVPRPVLQSDAEYVVRPARSASTARPQWPWYFNAPSTWLGRVLSLNPR